MLSQQQSNTYRKKLSPGTHGKQGLLVYSSLLLSPAPYSEKSAVTNPTVNILVTNHMILESFPFPQAT